MVHVRNRPAPARIGYAIFILIRVSPHQYPYSLQEYEAYRELARPKIPLLPRGFPDCTPSSLASANTSFSRGLGTHEWIDLDCWALKDPTVIFFFRFALSLIGRYEQIYIGG